MRIYAQNWWKTQNLERVDSKKYKKNKNFKKNA